MAGLLALASRLVLRLEGKMMLSTLSSQFSYVQEWEDEFLSLFSHRFDYIYAAYPDASKDPEWRTESRHPLSDRILRQGAFLFGVRFGAKTDYCMLDIDKGSRYHPHSDPLAISRMLAALEAIGLVSYVTCTSSYSGGLHLYFPFQQAQSSWELAIGVATLLENAGFAVKPGQLEVFPNPKPYSVEGKPTLFNAHRLPLQVGSYLLNQEFQAVSSYQHAFVRQWRFAQARNAIEPEVLKRILKQAKRRHFCISGKADKFINDLNAEIELGWTGFGQTNRLLGRITMRTYIFHHVMAGGSPLTGEALVTEIVRVARSLPGYTEWCRHRHEIEQRAEEWARCIEASHYFRYGERTGKYQLKTESLELEPALTGLPTWNQQQAAGARERIRLAIADLLDKNQLPAGATARFRALTKYGIGGGSLYRHRDLWHPNHVTESAIESVIESVTESDPAVVVATNELRKLAEPVEIPPHPPGFIETAPSDQADLPSNGCSSTSLFPGIDGDNALGKASSRPNAASLPDSGRNSGEPQLDWFERFAGVEGEGQQLPLLDRSTWSLITQEAMVIAQSETKRLKQEAQERSHVARMQQFLTSGDPILVAEAWAWAAVNPGVLDTSRLKLPEVQSLLSTVPGSLCLSIDGVELEQSRGNEKHQDEPLTLEGGASFHLADAAGMTGSEVTGLEGTGSDWFDCIDWFDCSDLLAAISIELRRLAWTSAQIQQALQHQFGKGSQSRLTGAELQQWLMQLTMLPGAEK